MGPRERPIPEDHALGAARHHRSGSPQGKLREHPRPTREEHRAAREGKRRADQAVEDIFSR